MASNALYVVDTNVLISAAMFPDSQPRKALDAARTHGSILLSRALLAELADVIRRPKFDHYISHDDRDLFLASLYRSSRMLLEVQVAITACRDPKDNHILELGVSGGATCIITGDDDLLALDPFQGIPVRTPDAFLASLTADQ